ncbi:hypothetical protein Rsub_11314 [Raphidocelis subcapitata]|uniref:Uncharacterized protein n=1 Tax=Raphidocelis subcapitata TaxID=307507 RepID=A0A2V0PGB7_9CHLO|nr:hypothetical protein Rsub_11314 [Raphidocelis subcapitata]|eukprot:GBF98589.1 hypothetical protein Rsub_11314 [Raphidocelis subcapitata]
MQQQLLPPLPRDAADSSGGPSAARSCRGVMHFDGCLKQRSQAGQGVPFAPPAALLDWTAQENLLFDGHCLLGAAGVAPRRAAHGRAPLVGRVWEAARAAESRGPLP